MAEVARHLVGGTAIIAVHGDLTRQSVDAIVNAANEYLAHGGGVAAALVTAGGRSIQEESDRWVADHGPLAPGEAAVTAAGSLAARNIIHVVGPRYRQGQDNAGLLRAAVHAALDAAAGAGDRTIAFPAISAGIFGYPLDEATAVIVAAVTDWLDTHPDTLTEVRVVGYDHATAQSFAAALG